MKDKLIFVTGGGSGLGLELVRLAWGRGYRVICTGRRGAQDLPDDFPDIPYLCCDMSSQHGAQQAADWALAQSGGRIDCALLNAAAGYFRPLVAETAASITDVMALNLEANMILTHRLAPALDGGTLALIGSVARKGAAGMPVYASSKGALDGFGRALAEEWRGRVRVRVLHPGPTATGMSARAGRKPDFADRVFLSPRAMAHCVLDAALARKGADRQVISYGRVLFHPARLLRRGGT
ncbi:SDR family NAD(P)-dependent oxidoreductase [Roseinatronobacter sp. NSM]|uniref:SDR family NAD(P)-dependent oxidoreductase n=1 Tax=Roseinatronobacter sp. NSM TaxID=3457785 RepID=UPI0040364304